MEPALPAPLRAGWILSHGLAPPDGGPDPGRAGPAVHAAAALRSTAPGPRGVQPRLACPCGPAARVHGAGGGVRQRGVHGRRRLLGGAGRGGGVRLPGAPAPPAPCGHRRREPGVAGEARKPVRGAGYPPPLSNPASDSVCFVSNLVAPSPFWREFIDYKTSMITDEVHLRLLLQG